MITDKKACIFDLDGTLVDSMWMWEKIDIEYLSGFGIQLPYDLQHKIEGMSFSETAVYFKKRFQLPVSLEEIKQSWVNMSIDKYRHEVKLKPGAKEFLYHIKSLGIKAGIATSNGRDMVDAVVEALNIKDFFNSITTACEVNAGKPAPDIYLKVACDLNTMPSDCLVFEDIPAGIIAGKRAGMDVCAIDDEFSKDIREEKKKLADYFINDYFDLM